MKIVIITRVGEFNIFRNHRSNFLVCSGLIITVALGVSAYRARALSLTRHVWLGSMLVSGVALAVFYRETSLRKNIIRRTDWTSWNDASQKDLGNAVDELNKKFNDIEDETPYLGYIVRFVDGTKTSSPKWELLPCGNRRVGGKEVELSGVPSDQANARDQCLFCQHSHASDKPLPVLTWENCYGAKSLSGQLLIIPTQHFPHWFQTPREVQISLLQRGFQERKKANVTSKPVELHCGSAGGQTVFHTHLRTAVVIEKKI